MTNLTSSIDQFLLQARIAIENSLNDEEIRSRVSFYGYNEERLNEGSALLENAVNLVNDQNVEYGRQYSATEELNKKRDEAKAVYTRFVKIARIALQGEAGNYRKLGLYGKRETTFSGWLNQARQFYANVLEDAEITAALSAYGISKEDLEDGNKLLDETENLYNLREQKRGIARQSKIDKDNAIRELDIWLSDYIKIARIALEETPQILEKLGIVVPSK